MSIFLDRVFLTPLIMASVLALGACETAVETAHKSALPDPVFERTLHRAYLGMAQAEYDEADYKDSNWFAGRVIQLAGGNSVTPVDLSTRNVPADAADELASARERLVSALASPDVGKIPFAAANAQASFDCWVQEKEENIQPLDIAACRDRFMEAIALTEGVVSPPPPPPPAPPTVAEAAPQPPRFYSVLFDFDSAALTDAAQGTIGGILTDWLGKGHHLTVVGHADTAGRARYNQELSEERAANVSQALEAGGVGFGWLTAVGVGETNLAVPTADGVPEQANRRVTVSIVK